MSDTRAAIRELRSLSEKRSTQGLTEQERSRLAELRERLGLPSEPAEVRAGGTQPGGTPAPFVAPVPPTPAPSPGNGTPVAAAPLPSFESAAAPSSPAAESTPVAEVESPVSAAVAEPGATEMGADPLEASLDNLEAAPPEEPLPVLTSPAQVTRFEALPPAEAATDPAIDLRGVVDAVEPESFQASEPLPVSDPQDPVAELEALAAETATPPSEPVEATASPADGVSASDDGSAWTSALLETSADGQEAVEALPPSAPEALDAVGDPEPVPARRSLAERIDAAVEAGEVGEASEALDSSTGEAAESAGWGAAPVGTEPLVPEDLGATPLDV
ncbi:MAG TPA: hypothetical protein VFN91_13880, partial [Myxococcaceae bacterium]|nr:hypothetical protein [Myxococcaceae bacterium]